MPISVGTCQVILLFIALKQCSLITGIDDETSTGKSANTLESNHLQNGTETNEALNNLSIKNYPIVKTPTVSFPLADMPNNENMTNVLNNSREIDPSLLQFRAENIHLNSFLDYISVLEISFKDETVSATKLSCAEKCGDFQAGHCSCRPSCRALKTCCLDFFDVCVGSIYSLPQIDDEFSWLQDVDLTCVNQGVVVSSCRSDKTSGEFLYDAVPGNVTEDDLYKRILRTDNLIELISLSQLVTSQMLLIETPISLGLKRLLSNIIIQDMSTGISYMNASVFACNGGHWTHARPWTARIDFNLVTLIPNHAISSLEFLLSYIEGNDSKFLSIESAPERDLDSLCFTHVISSCPQNFPDSSVTEKCEQTFLPYSFRDKSGNPDSVVDFKNPYCQFCHVGLDPLDFIGPALSAFYLSKKIFNIHFGNNSIDVVFQNGLSLYNPAWRVLTCVITAPETSESRGTSDKELETIQLTSKTKCTVTECLSKLFGQIGPADDCHWTLHMKLLLPPAAKRMERTELEEVIRANVRSLQIAMRGWDLKLVPDTIEVLEERTQYNSLLIDYVISFVLQTDAYFDVKNHFPIPFDQIPSVLWSGNPFPFRYDARYFCMLGNYNKYSIAYALYLLPLRCYNIPEASGAKVIPKENLMLQASAATKMSPMCLSSVYYHRLHKMFYGLDYIIVILTTSILLLF